MAAMVYGSLLGLLYIHSFYALFTAVGVFVLPVQVAT